MVSAARPVAESKVPHLGDLRAQVAGVLLSLHPGDRVPTVRSLARDFGVSVGATQGALARLEEMGAVHIQPRGRMGAYMHSRSIGKLWLEAEREPLIVALPLPNTQHVNGLATAVKALFADADVPSFCVFMRGSRQRFEALRQGRCHIAVMSALAAEERLPDETIVLELPAETLVAAHRVYFAERAGEHPSTRRLRVILDRDSADFQRIAEVEFGRLDVDWVPGTYNQLNRLLREDQADAGIWDIEEDVGRLQPAVLNRPLSPHAIDALRGRDTKATFVAKFGADSVRAVVTGALRADRLTAIQRQVIDGDRVAEY
jgi:hypothetical protein